MFDVTFGLAKTTITDTAGELAFGLTKTTMTMPLERRSCLD